MTTLNNQDGIHAKEASSTDRKSLSKSASRQNNDYPIPSVIQAPLNILHPLLVPPDGIEVRVAYGSMITSDEIIIRFNGKDTFVPQNGAESGAVIFKVSAGYIARALNESVNVEYVVTRNGTPTSSQTLSLKILPLTEEDLEMPIIEEATEGTLGVLDLSQFQGDAHIKMLPWPLIEANTQRVWLDMKWGSEIVRVIRDHVVTSDEAKNGIMSIVARPELDRIQERREVMFAPQVLFDKNGLPSEAFDLPSLKLELLPIGEGTGDIIEDFTRYASGAKTSPWEAQEMTFTGRGLETSVGASYSVFKANIQQGISELAIQLNNSTYKRASVDVQTDNHFQGRFRCLYGNGLVDEKPIGAAITTLEFFHEGINAFEAVATYDEFATTIIIDSIKLYQ